MSNVTELPKPKVVIDRMALEKIKFFVAKDELECSGMGITRVVGDTIYIDDIQMLKQKNGAAHTDINEDAVTKLMFDWRERPGEINFWWHSHVNMGVFWSGTDTATIKQLGQHGLCVASVFNKKGEIRTAVACKINVPFCDQPQVIIFDEIPLMVAPLAIDDEIKAAWTKEHEENVSRGWSGAGSWGGGSGHTPFREATTFKPCFTKVPGYWDSAEQGREFDTDWINGSEMCRQSNLWKQSNLYLSQLNTWRRQQGLTPIPLFGRGRGDAKPPQGQLALPSHGDSTTTPPRLGDVDDKSVEDYAKKLAYAKNHEEILAYNAVLDMFELYSGVKIAADWYMDDKNVGYRMETREDYIDDLMSGRIRFHDSQDTVALANTKAGVETSEVVASTIDKNIEAAQGQYGVDIRKMEDGQFEVGFDGHHERMSYEQMADAFGWERMFD